MPLESNPEVTARTGRPNQYIHRGDGVDDQRVEIISISDGESDYHDGQGRVDLGKLAMDDGALRIRYRVVGYAQRIKLWIEYEPSEVHERFYAKYRTPSFRLPRVATFIEEEGKSPGEYVFEWNGRDDTPDERLLLAGSYTVKLAGVVERVLPTRVTDATTLKVDKPSSFNFGIHYKKGQVEHDTTQNIKHAANQQKSLSDGTKYSVDSQLALTADEALTYMQRASVVYFDGHSNPESIFFHDAKGGAYRREDSSELSLFGGSETPPDASLQSLRSEDPMALKDLFFILLEGCRTVNEVYMVQRTLRMFNPKGIDGIHGPLTAKALRRFQYHNDLDPANGEKNDETLDWFGISKSEPEAEMTREIQRRLTSYFPGPLDGKMGPKTRGGLENYQQDHSALDETGEIDDPTIEALSLGRSLGEEASMPLNLSAAMGYIGADIVLGFEHKITFKVSRDWAHTFWEQATDGQGINTAANNAVAMLDHRYHDEMEFRVYTQEGVSPEATLHPARYGKAKRE